MPRRIFDDLIRRAKSLSGFEALENDLHLAPSRHVDGLASSLVTVGIRKASRVERDRYFDNGCSRT